MTVKLLAGVAFAVLGFGMAAGVAAAQQASAPAAAAAAAKPKGDPVKGKDVFDSAGCSACHTLADAGATGSVGPVLDGDPHITNDFVVARVTSGQGAMPPFAGTLSDQEIADVAAYVTEKHAK